MATVSNDLVERVARSMYEVRYPGMVWDNETDSMQESYRDDARAAIAALSTPEFVLPLAEEMLRGKRARRVALVGSIVSVRGVRQELPGGQQVGPTESYGQGHSLLDAFKEMEGC